MTAGCGNCKVPEEEEKDGEEKEEEGHSVNMNGNATIEGKEREGGMEEEVRRGKGDD